MGRAVSFHSRRMAWRSAADRMSRLPIGCSGFADRGRQQPNKPLRQRLDGSPIEQVRGVLKDAVYAGRRSIGGAVLSEREGQIESGARHIEVLGLHGEPRHRKVRRRIVLQNKKHLEQRMPRQRALGVEHFHQPLERQVLMSIGRKVVGAHSPDQFAQARIARRVGAQHQGVDEEANQIIKRRIGAPRDRTADRDIVARAKPREQRRQRPPAAP